MGPLGGTHVPADSVNTSAPAATSTPAAAAWPETAAAVVAAEAAAAAAARAFRQSFTTKAGKDLQRWIDYERDDLPCATHEVVQAVKAHVRVPQGRLHMAAVATAHAVSNPAWQDMMVQHQQCPLAAAVLATMPTSGENIPTILSSEWGRVAVMDVVLSSPPGKRLFAKVRSFLTGQQLRQQMLGTALTPPESIMVMMRMCAGNLDETYQQVASTFASPRLLRSTGLCASRTAAGAGRQ